MTIFLVCDFEKKNANKPNFIHVHISEFLNMYMRYRETTEKYIIVNYKICSQDVQGTITYLLAIHSFMK